MLLAPGAAQHPSREGPEFPATQVQFPGMTTPAPPTPLSGEAAREDRQEQVRDCLRAVVDPELGDTIVDLGMVRTINVEDGDVTVGVALTIAACPLRSQIERDVVNHVRSLDWVRSVDVQVASMDADERAAVMARARQFPGQEQQVFQYYASNPQAQAEIRAPLFEDKVVDFIAELAEVTSKNVDRETLFKDPDDLPESIRKA